ncbi:MAG: universal stress protein, partial [Gemmatimonadetes bacterium]|nr:universal stress protein [Gemmatimonadota bacterium]
ATAVIVHASPAAGILDFAERNAVDLIAMATHGRGGVSRIMLGSVADKVLRGARAPVLLYRPPVRLHGAGAARGRLAVARRGRSAPRAPVSGHPLRS